MISFNSKPVFQWNFRFAQSLQFLSSVFLSLEISLIHSKVSTSDVLLLSASSKKRNLFCKYLNEPFAFCLFVPNGIFLRLEAFTDEHFSRPSAIAFREKKAEMKLFGILLQYRVLWLNIVFQRKYLFSSHFLSSGGISVNAQQRRAKSKHFACHSLAAKPPKRRNFTFILSLSPSQFFSS